MCLNMLVMNSFDDVDIFNDYDTTQLSSNSNIKCIFTYLTRVHFRRY